MPVNSPLLEQCFDEAVRHAAPSLGRCIDLAVSSMQQEEKDERDVAARDRCARAWYALLKHRQTWGAAFTQKLKVALQNGYEEGGTSSMGLLSNSQLLALVDESAVNESIESARILQNLLPEVEQALAVLDARMSSLIGLHSVHAEKNPLRPSIYVRVLRELMTASEGDPEIRTLWMRHVAVPLGRELRTLYEQLALMLQKANVQEASYRVRLVADPQASKPAGHPKRDLLDFEFTPGGQAVQPDRTNANADTMWLPPMADLARAEPMLDHDVMQQFLEQGGSEFDKPLDQNYFQALDRARAELQALASIPVLDEVVLEEERTRFRELPAVDRPVRHVSIASQLSGQTWGEMATATERSRVLLDLKSQARSVAQAVGLDVVRKLVNQVARDPLLLAPVREAVVALEPALLQQAMTQPRYFNEDAHPARRLVESVAQRSFRYNDEFSEEFESFFGPVREAFRTLNERAAKDPKAFGEVLDKLRGDWRSRDEREESVQNDRLHALRHAEERQAKADQIAWDLSQRPDIENAPAFILDFIYGSWALVLASAEMGLPKSQDRLNAYRKAVSDLLWSIRKEVTLRRPAELFRIVPGLVKTLRQGLEELGKSEDETRGFFDQLLRLHEPVLGLRRAKVRSDSGHSDPIPLEGDATALIVLEELTPATPEQRVPKAAAQPWIGQRELADAGFEDTIATDFGGLHGVDLDSSTGSLDEQSAFDAEQMLFSLKEGAWVDLYSHGEWLRAQLTWASNRGTLFMFTSRGGRAHSMTKRVCIRLIRNRWLRPVEARPVVQTALDAVLTAGPPPVLEPVSMH
ncbi:MAG: DUF1631 family protein [Hydrogenophaga sp.]|uniref:DUF1631 family protein n=1 Tax=Hydrogenophaga sp. TaxID=1904254 RepID=UPI001E04FEFD|nr:DUF1631 family protein [Hydrogenophaga sp.]MBX3609812.1 DUF1631 family protein [Hydrogenophaga sp.]